MSAFVVSNRHINALSRAARESQTAIYTNGNWWKIKSLEDQKTVGKILIAENSRSVNARYNSKDDPEQYTIVQDMKEYTPAEILKACACYIYQACETDDWEQTLAYKIIAAIKESQIRLLEGYETADWEISDQDPDPTPPTPENEPEGMSKSQKINMTLTEILKEVRIKAKSEFPGCKFSIRKNHYNSMTLSIMQANFKVIEHEQTETYIINRANLGNWRNTNDRDYMQNKGIEKYLAHIDINKHTFREDYTDTEPKGLNHNIVYTEKGYNMLKRIIEIVEYYNWDESDIQTDYFNVNFYDHFELGTWEKPFIQA